MYQLGRDTDGVEEENWIIRWLLWHAFRYRDQRNNRNRRAGMPTDGQVDGEREGRTGPDSSEEGSSGGPGRKSHAVADC